jgi:ATP-binding cassette subfamily F protein 3
MSLIIADGVSRLFGVHEVLASVSFRLAEGDRVGLVGPNGCGKTTLLRLLAGLDEPTDGQLSRARSLSVGYLPQDPPAARDVTLREALLEVFEPLRRLEEEIHELSVAVAETAAAPDALDRLGKLQHRFEAEGGYDYPRRVDEVLTGLGFGPEMWGQSLATLSGGQRTRGWLGRLLLRRPALLLLDEPTNHLDLDSVAWLERWLSDYRGALVVVSHDRYFLDSVTRDTWELGFGRLETYRGSYSQYLPKRAERLAQRQAQYTTQQQYVEQTLDFVRRFGAGQRSKEARGRKTRLERFLRDEAIDRPREEGTIDVRLSPTERSGELVLRAMDIEAGYKPGEALVSAQRLEVRRGQRIAIVGPNGCGKTTLLRTLLGELEPLAGAVSFGSNVMPGYLSQNHSELETSDTVLSALRRVDQGLKPERARTLLGSFLFSGDDVLKTVDQLSGGQRSRLLLARLSVAGANLLMLDEPTNHLDIPSQEVLQSVLDDYDGTVMMVSHDRYLIEALATDLWVVGEGGVKALPGQWGAYLDWRSDVAAGDSQAPADADEPCRQQRKTDYRQRRAQRNHLQRLQRRQGQMEEQVHKFERLLEDLSNQISSAGEEGRLDEVEDLGRQYAQTQRKLDAAMAEWEHVGEELEGLTESVQ